MKFKFVEIEFTKFECGLGLGILGTFLAFTIGLCIWSSIYYPQPINMGTCNVGTGTGC